MIVEVWQKVLGFDNIGVNEDFFMLGGDSMTAMEIVLQLQEYGLKISVEDLFKNLTIRELAKDIKYEEKSNLGMNT